MDFRINVLRSDLFEKSKSQQIEHHKMKHLFVKPRTEALNSFEEYWSWNKLSSYKTLMKLRKNCTILHYLYVT